MTESTETLLETVIRLPERADIDAAEDIRARLLDARDSLHSVRIDAGAVTRIDTRVLQLLVAAQTEFSAAGRSASVFSPSQDFVVAARSLGLARLLEET